MTTHVKAVAVLFLILGIFGLLAATVIAMAFGLASGIVGANAEPHDAAIALPIIGLTGTMLVAYLLATSLPGVIAAIGLLRLRPWARVLGIVAAVLYLIHIPFGTAVGAYAIWVLVNKDTERLLETGAPAAVV